MTHNNIKIAVFTALTVALLAPLSIMDNAYAQEKVVDSLKIPNAERDIKLAAGFELYPGVGWVAPDRVKIDPIYTINPNDRGGDLILDVDAMMKIAEKNEASITKTSGNVLDDFWNSFYQIAEAVIISYDIIVKDDPSNDITYHRAYWNVPTSPGTYSGGTNFDFNAVQPTSTTNMIFQPVLQHGFSDWCDAGNDWVTYPFMYVFGSPYGGSCIDADENDLIRGILSESNNVWKVSIKNYGNPAATDSYSVYYSGTMETLFTAVELHNIPTDCTELQGDVEYKYQTDSGDVVAWTAATSGSSFCGMSQNIVSDSTTQFNNNN